MVPLARLLLPGLLLLALLPARAAAAEDGAPEQRLTLNGFGGVAGGWSDPSPYLAASPDLTRHYLNAGLLARAQPLDPLVLHVFVFLEAQGGHVQADLDWAFAEWAFSDRVRLRLGRAPLPLGLYSETFDIGTLRPFFFLPQGVYGPSGLGAESYDGVGLTGRLGASGDWELAYDAYLGFLTPNLDAAPYAFLQPDVQDGPATRPLAGGRLSLGAPVPGLALFTSAYVARAGPGAGAEGVVGAGAAWLADALSVRAEAFLRLGAHVLRSGYVEAAWFLTPNWQLAARVDALQERADGVPDDSPLLAHRALALGLNHWFAPQLVAKLSYQLVGGNRFAHPDDVEGALARDALALRTHAVTLGAQFSF